jgi:hypothetical protein
LYVVAEVVAGESRKLIDHPRLLSAKFTYGTTVPLKVGEVEGWAIFVEFLTKLSISGLPAMLIEKFEVTNTRMVLVAEVGVMLTLNPVISTKVVDALEKVSFLNVLTTCNTVPAGIVPLGIVLDPVSFDAETSTI